MVTRKFRDEYTIVKCEHCKTKYNKYFLKDPFICPKLNCCGLTKQISNENKKY